MKTSGVRKMNVDLEEFFSHTYQRELNMGSVLEWSGAVASLGGDGGLEREKEKEKERERE